MKKVIAILLVITAGQIFAEDLILTIRIPAEQAALIRDGMLAVWPNSQTIVDPSWVQDPNEPSVKPPMVQKYTVKRWLRYLIKKFVLDTAQQGQNVIARRSRTIIADDAIEIVDDPNALQ
ncbi:hypothetical protein KAR91_57405 [Candidatus Pacearchaeota archaeon]|nr:hypothetical protein [Candidatus Pacearchaeota archaeon]